MSAIVQPAWPVDPLDLCFPWWLHVLREHGYDARQIAEPMRTRVRSALAIRGVAIGPARAWHQQDAAA